MALLGKFPCRAATFPSTGFVKQQYSLAKSCSTRHYACGRKDIAVFQSRQMGRSGSAF